MTEHKRNQDKVVTERQSRAATAREHILRVSERSGEKVMQASVAKATSVRQDKEDQIDRRIHAPKDGMEPYKASQEEIEKISVMLNQRLAEVVPDPSARGWYKMFNHMDDDCSGKISYWELEDMVRNELKVPLKQMSINDLQAIWRALDEDRSGVITSGEFGQFMRLGDHVHKRDDTGPLRLLKAKKAQSAEQRDSRHATMAEWRRNMESTADRRREKALGGYQKTWGLTPTTSTPHVWRSPRARVVA